MKSKPEEQNKRATNHPTQHHWHEMNRKQRREMMRKMQNEDLSLEVIHPDAGGIDIGNESHYVAVPPSRDSQSVREFGCTTAELKAMAVWLKQCRIRTVAMQSTGVYWVAVYAILAGERDSHKLAQFRDPRVKASEEQIAQSLEGNWQEDLLFVLKQEHEGYEFCHKQMAECDRQLKQYLQQREDRSQGAPLPEEKRKGRLKKKRANKPQFDLREGLFRMTGTDLTRIDGIDVMTAMTIISEAGWDMSKWPDEDHFVSWLRLCPDNRISGNKVIGKGRLPTNNPISIALKMAASTLRQSKTYLGAQFRRFRTRLGAPIAIKAMAAKLARLVYRMLRYGMKYVDQGAAFYELRHRELQIKRLKAKAEKLGYRVTPIPAAA